MRWRRRRRARSSRSRSPTIPPVRASSSTTRALRCRPRAVAPSSRSRPTRASTRVRAGCPIFMAAELAACMGARLELSDAPVREGDRRHGGGPVGRRSARRRHVRRQAARTSRIAASLGPMRVLIVEDSDSICRMIEALVAARGFEVRCAGTRRARSRRGLRVEAARHPPRHQPARRLRRPPGLHEAPRGREHRSTRPSSSSAR